MTASALRFMGSSRFLWGGCPHSPLKRGFARSLAGEVTVDNPLELGGGRRYIQASKRYLEEIFDEDVAVDGAGDRSDDGNGYR